MMEDDDLLEEFTIEALELLDDAENGLLQIEKGAHVKDHYNCIFRSLHSLKGASGMMGVDKLQKYVHQIETNFSSQSNHGSIQKVTINYFLSGVDQMRSFLNGNLENLDVNSLVYPKEVIEEEEEKSKVEDNPKNITPTPQLTLGKVYIIDDEPEIVQIISEQLEDMDLTIQEFIDTDALIAKLDSEEELPHLIISDFQMPKMDGEALLEYVNKNYKPIPFLYISAFLDKELVIKLFDMGAVGFIDKPFDSEDLMRKVKSALYKSQSSRLLDLTIEALLSNFGDVEELLQKSGKKQILKLIRDDLKQILEQRKILQQL